MGLSVADSGGGDMMPLNDCYGSQTVAFGTAMTYLLPPAGENVRTCSGGVGYLAGGTAHTLTAMVTLQTGKITADAVSGQAVVKVSKPFTDSGGNIMAANDYVSWQYEDGTFGSDYINSVAGLSITLTTNLAKNIDKNAPIWFHGTQSDHTSRQFTLPASVVYHLPSGDLRLRSATGSDKNTPIIMHVNNITATGIWLYQQVYYD